MLVTAREMLTNSRRQILRYLASHWIGRWQVVSVSAAQGCHENDGASEMPTDQHLVNPQTLALTEQRTRTHTHTHQRQTPASRYPAISTPDGPGLPFYTRLHEPFPARSQTSSQLLSQNSYCLTHQSRIVADHSLARAISTRSRAIHYDLPRK
jgi:hypothetical protein